MDPKDGSLWFAQQLVETLQRDVAQLESELKTLLSHRALLLHAFSMPTFPPGYTPSGPVNAENSHRLNDRSNARSFGTPDIGPSSRYSTLASAHNTPVMGTRNAPPPPERRSPSTQKGLSQENGSESGTSEDSYVAPTTSKQQDRNQPSRPETVSVDPPVGRVNFRSCDSDESSESTEVKVLPSPVNKKIRNQPSFPVVNWTQQIKKRTAASLNGRSSSDSGDSISSDASTEKGPSKRLKVTNTGKTATSAAPPTKVATQAQTLSSDAPPEDLFDWEVLGILGPWSPDRSSSLLANSSWSQLQKQQSPLPCQFQTIDEYRSSFEGYIFEECKALLNCSWDVHKCSLPGTRQNISEIRGVPEERGHGSLWQFRPMYPSAHDPFKYVEAELVDGSDLRLDPSEVVLLTHGNTNILAVVTLTNYKGVLLRTRLELPATSGQCVLLRMANMVTLKRQYVSLCRVTEMWDPLQQQLLNPLESSNFLIPPPSDSSTEDDVKVHSSIKTVLAWKKERLFNKKQLCAIEALLYLRQGFLLVQGPPGTGKEWSQPCVLRSLGQGFLCVHHPMLL